MTKWIDGWIVFEFIHEGETFQLFIKQVPEPPKLSLNDILYTPC